MLAGKTNIILLLCCLTAEVYAEKLTVEDYLCTIFPPNCPKIIRSTSLEPVRLVLSTELGVEKENVTDRLISFEFVRAYIRWLSTAKNNTHDQFRIVAALPDLLPHTLWKKQTLENARSKSNMAGKIGKLEFEMHRNWLSITIQSYSQKYNYCSRNKCYRSNVEVARNSVMMSHSKLLKEDADFRYYTGGAVTKEWTSYDAVLIPKKLNPKLHFYMQCDINKSTTYNWCKARSLLDKDIALGYWFEVKHLPNFYELDKKIRRFVRASIISDTHKGKRQVK